MRVLWLSNGPLVKSGYGTVTRHVLRGLAGSKHEVICYGNTDASYITYEGIPVLPNLANSPEGMWKCYYRRFKPDILVTLIDVWALESVPRECPVWCAYHPLDSLPSEAVLSRLRKACWVVVPTKWAVETLKEHGIKAHYIPHGVDPGVFRPLDRRECKDRFGLGGAWVVGVVAMNKGERKGIREAIEAFRIFVDGNPDAKDAVLYLHTNEVPAVGGVDVHRLVVESGLTGRVAVTDFADWAVGFDDATMARLYNAFDVLLLPSRGEGFGLPLLEAQACGTPVITTAFAGGGEVARFGWVVRPDGYISTDIGVFANPSPERFADALSEAYNHGQPAKNLDWIAEYSWDRVVAMWGGFLDRVDEERSAPEDHSRPRFDGSGAHFEEADVDVLGTVGRSRKYDWVYTEILHRVWEPEVLLAKLRSIADRVYVWLPDPGVRDPKAKWRIDPLTLGPLRMERRGSGWLLELAGL